MSRHETRVPPKQCAHQSISRRYRALVVAHGETRLIDALLRGETKRLSDIVIGALMKKLKLGVKVYWTWL